MVKEIGIGQSAAKFLGRKRFNDYGLISQYWSSDWETGDSPGVGEKIQSGLHGKRVAARSGAGQINDLSEHTPKRVNFIAIQHGHGVACNGYRQNAIRTGYEQVIPYKAGEMFAFMAKQSGKVISANAQGIVIEYKDGERKGVHLGTVYGKAAGLVIPHNIVTRLKTGDVFDEGDPIAYNDGFFEPDFLNPKQIIWKSAVNAKTVLLESADTLEDSSAISKRLAGELQTKITKVRTVVVGFNQQIHRLVTPGQRAETASILCVIDDNIGRKSTVMDDSILHTLRVLTAQTPTAKMQGTIERVELYYHGDKEDMSDSLRVLADQSDLQISRRNKSAGKKAFTGSVDENFRIDNEALALDTVAVQIYITAEVDSSVGDKGVFANQLKTVFGRVFGDKTMTESGKPIDAIFGAKSVDDRIVLSPIVIGTTTTLLDVIGKKAVELYEK